MGNVFVKDEIDDGHGMRNTRAFLNTFFKNFIDVSVKYFSFTNEYHFNYRERQTHSVLFPAIVKSSDASIVEQPVKRKSKGVSRSGRIDYWVASGETAFIIEAKHSWQHIKKHKARKSTITRWKGAYNQLQSIKKKEINELGYGMKSFVKIILHVVPTYFSADKTENLTYPTKKEAFDVLDSVSRQLKPAPNWFGLWHIHRDIVEYTELKKGSWENYPSVMVFVLATGMSL